MGKSTISMAIFNSYLKLPEGKPPIFHGPMSIPLVSRCFPGRLLEQLMELGCFRMQPQAASVFALEVQNLQQQLEMDLEMGRGLKFETLQPQKR